MQESNTLMIAAAGAGKTTYIVKRALEIKDSNVLITTYTTSNKEEIIRKIIKQNKSIPPNIIVQTWVSFLMQHGVKPYQGNLFQKKIMGYLLCNTASGLKYKSGAFPVYYKEDGEFEKHYFSSSQKLYSDKLAKFVVRANSKSDGEVFSRISRIFSNIFIDEVQDLAGNDLEILKLLFESNSNILLVGDPRQVTYLTHNEKLHSPYNDGKIENFLKDKCNKIKFSIDKTTLIKSHRNNAQICEFASKFYPDELASFPCECLGCRSELVEHEGVFVIKEVDVENYINKFNPAILRYQMSSDYEWNFGESKGLTFERVLIYPTKPMKQYLLDGKLNENKIKKTLKTEKLITRPCFDIAKFYVAVTRARYSVAIVYDFENENFIEGILKYPIN